MSQTLSGTYIGVVGTPTQPGGTGLNTEVMEAFATLTGSALAVGGAGYTYTQFGVSGSPAGGSGGIGVSVAVGGLTNFGTIDGGAGGNGLIPTTGSGDGGVGIYLGNARVLQNFGMIKGGAGGEGGTNFAQADGAGGAAADFSAGGTFENSGFVTGGAGGSSNSLGHLQGGAGGAGVYFGGTGLLYSTGVIAGGVGGIGSGTTAAGGGGNGVEMKSGGVLNNNFGTIAGGNGGLGEPSVSYGGNGGTGILLDQTGNVVNGASIRGGNGGNSSNKGGNGGIGLHDAAGGFITNYGFILGGNGGSSGPLPFGSGAAGGVGMELGVGGVLENTATIRGGEGGNEGGAGGAGVILQGGTSPYNINLGLISGGAAILVGDGAPGYGGVGLEMLTTGTFRNFGTITGGTGAVAKVRANIAYGGGAYFAGGSTLENAGSIAETGNADAVLFGGTGGSTLLLDPGSSIKGIAEAKGTGNVLALEGVPNPAYGLNTTLSGLGTQYIGFQTLEADTGSEWTVAGTIATLSNDGAITITSGTSLDITGSVAAASTGVFALTGKAKLEIASLLGSNTQIEFLGTTGGGTLTLDNPSQFGLNFGSSLYAGPLLEDFAAGDGIDLKGIGHTGFHLSFSKSGVLQITSASKGAVASLHFQISSLGHGGFHLISDGAGGMVLTRG